jgi:hypothetical protein
MLAVVLSCIAFIMLRYILSIPSFLRAFMMKWCYILSKAFSASIEMIKWFLSLLLLMCYITFIDLHMLNHHCIPEMKPTWSRWMIFLMCYWIWLAIILLSIFHQCTLRKLAYSSPFWRCLCLVLDKCNTGFIKCIRQFSFPFYFME